ncbi:hypothetical protein F3J44_01865 [Pantoea sp. Tr-811]|uniref:hypothetical protein n=1 Tax=Pantoea sp. Tr-811 TaxID=2608361 RepID=UPI00141EE5C9|nr:hypothetical protein [Pantoea sp. Tr-811]NIF25120.1 hypothetical protein [Pantoea sp. Tr-811]
MVCVRIGLLAVLLGLAAPALAEQASSEKGCIDVQVGQSRALAFDCLSKQLQGNDPRAGKALRAQVQAGQQVDKRQPSQLGLATPAATATRMGNSFGTSVVPQRP